MRLTEIAPGESFTDEMDAGDFVVRAVEGVDAAFFSASPDPDALLGMLRPLARREGTGR